MGSLSPLAFLLLFLCRRTHLTALSLFVVAAVLHTGMSLPACVYACGRALRGVQKKLGEKISLSFLASLKQSTQ